MVRVYLYGARRLYILQSGGGMVYSCLRLCENVDIPFALDRIKYCFVYSYRYVARACSYRSEAQLVSVKDLGHMRLSDTLLLYHSHNIPFVVTLDEFECSLTLTHRIDKVQTACAILRIQHSHNTIINKQTAPYRPSKGHRAAECASGEAG